MMTQTALGYAPDENIRYVAETPKARLWAFDLAKKKKAPPPPTTAGQARDVILSRRRQAIAARAVQDVRFARRQKRPAISAWRRESAGCISDDRAGRPEGGRSDGTESPPNIASAGRLKDRPTSRSPARASWWRWNGRAAALLNSSTSAGKYGVLNRNAGRATRPARTIVAKPPRRPRRCVKDGEAWSCEDTSFPSPKRCRAEIERASALLAAADACRSKGSGRRRPGSRA